MTLAPMPSAAELLRLKAEREARRATRGDRRATATDAPQTTHAAPPSPRPGAARGAGAAIAARTGQRTPLPLSGPQNANGTAGTAYAAQRAAGRGRQMNRTEARYAEYLETLRLAGLVRRYEYEPMTLHLAPGVRWRPDFRVQLADGTVEVHEVKGRSSKTGRWHATTEGRQKIRLGAALHPFPVVVVWPLAGGGWGSDRQPASTRPANAAPATPHEAGAGRPR